MMTTFICCGFVAQQVVNKLHCCRPPTGYDCSGLAVQLIVQQIVLQTVKESGIQTPRASVPSV